MELKIGNIYTDRRGVRVFIYRQVSDCKCSSRMRGIEVDKPSSQISNYTQSGRYLPHGEKDSRDLVSLYSSPYKTDSCDNGFEYLGDTLMEVSDDSESWGKRVVFGRKGNTYLAWSYTDSIPSARGTVCTTSWKYAREINQEQTEIHFKWYILANWANKYITKDKDSNIWFAWSVRPDLIDGKWVGNDSTTHVIPPTYTCEFGFDTGSSCIFKNPKYDKE